MYLDFLYIPLDYFSVLNKKEIRFEVHIPLAIGIASLCYSSCANQNSQYIFIQGVMQFIETLLGFTLAALTLSNLYVWISDFAIFAFDSRWSTFMYCLLCSWSIPDFPKSNSCYDSKYIIYLCCIPHYACNNTSCFVYLSNCDWIKVIVIFPVEQRSQKA